MATSRVRRIIQRGLLAGPMHHLVRATTQTGGKTVSDGTPLPSFVGRHGVWGKRSENKFIPDAIFELPDAQIARFLAVLFGCDGHVYCTDRLAQIGYTTISERLARDVQHLLLRFGISSCIRTLKRDVYEGTEKVAREVRITDQRSLARFAMTIRIPGKEDKLGEVIERLVTSSSETNVDTAPGRGLGASARRQGRAELGGRQ